MTERTADNLADAKHTEPAEQNFNAVLSRRIWLPKLIYAALPCFYILAGLMALAATLFVGEWFWVLPHYLLFACACLHMGVLIYQRRRQPTHPDR
ncbi:MAG: hypothetical protein AAF351_11660 [Pseudomonadota bacterium]